MTYGLPTVRLGRKTYFVDKRLSEIRNVRNPYDSEIIDSDLIRVWEGNPKMFKYTTGREV